MTSTTKTDLEQEVLEIAKAILAESGFPSSIKIREKFRDRMGCETPSQSMIEKIARKLKAEGQWPPEATRRLANLMGHQKRLANLSTQIPKAAPERRPEPPGPIRKPTRRYIGPFADDMRQSRKILNRIRKIPRPEPPVE